MILESIWQEILSFLTSLTSILRPMEWQALSCSIKLFKAMQQMLLMLLTIPHDIFLFKKNKVWCRFTCLSSPLHNDKYSEKLYLLDIQ